MKTSIVLFALAAFAVSAGAQSTTAQGTATEMGSAQSSVSKTATSAGASASAAEYSSAAGPAGEMSASAEQATQVSAALSKRIDSRDAKVGDEVVAKTTSEAKLADGTKIPKGSRLVGHVTEVEPKSHENKDGHVAFCFDHAVLRNGQQIPVHVLMRSLAAPAALSTSASNSDDIIAGGGMMAGGSAARSGSMVGGVAGGALRGTTEMAADTTTGLAAKTTSGFDATVNSMSTTSAPLGRERSGLSDAAGSYAAFSGPVGNLSGVTFSTVNLSGEASRSGVSGSGNASTATILTAHGRNASLDSGSQMTMAISAQRQ